MPSSQDCEKREDSVYHEMTTQQLQQILREDTFKSEAEGSDTEQILCVMEELARRRRESNERKSPEKALETFKREYDTENLLISETEEKNRTKHSKSLCIRGLAAVLALVILLAGGAVVADAFGANVWETIAKWTQETFHFGYFGQTDDDGIPGDADSKEYEGLREALLQLNIQDLKMPTWLPAGFSAVDVKVFENPKQRQVVARYQLDDKYIQIKIDDYIASNPERVEQSGDASEIYQTDGVEYYIFTDVDSIQAVWIADTYECYITGSLSLSEIKQMIDSIEKG